MSSPQYSFYATYGVAIASLALLYVIYGLGAGTWKISAIWEGADGRASASKFQFFLWTVVVFFAYIAIFIAKVTSNASLAMITADIVPEHVLTALGLSIATAAAAKGITTSYVCSGKISKQAMDPACQGMSDLLQDDSGVPDLSKIQMVGWTCVAIAIYLYTVVHHVTAILHLAPAQIHTMLVTAQASLSDNTLDKLSLPDISGSLMVLMGLGQGAYLGKKLVTTSTPRVTGASPSAVATHAGACVTVSGACFGASQDGNLVTLNGAPLHADIATWSDTSIVLAWPKTQTDNSAWVRGQQVSIGVIVNGQVSNTVPVMIL